MRAALPPSTGFESFHKALSGLYKRGDRGVSLDRHDTPAFSEEVWRKFVEHIYNAKGFTPDMLASPGIKAAIDETCGILTQAVDSVITRKVPKELTDRLHNDTFLFSGFKTFHEAREISSLLLDTETGSFKSFDKFFDDVRSINAAYNRNYLQAEYNFAVQSTQMAVKWSDFEQDGDRYLLQYRTAGDGLVRPEHQALHNTTLPIGDPFWNEYTPPLGWNCRCTVVQVNRGKYPESDSAAAIRAGEEATAKPKQKIFRFNPGKTGKVFPPKHPYFPKGCGDCRYRAQRRLGYKPNNQMCQACTVLANILNDGQTNTQQLRDRYFKPMSALYQKKVQVGGNGHLMSVGFNRYGNKHVFGDVLRGKNDLQFTDLLYIDQLLAQADFVKKSKLYKTRKDDIKRFYYYKTVYNGNTMYLHVAEEDFTTKRGKFKHKRYLYSITRKL